MGLSTGRGGVARASFLSALLALSALGFAQDGGDLGAPAPVEAPPLDPRAAQIRALLDGTLDVNVSAQSLFDVPLEDEAALEVEAARVRLLLSAVEQAERPAPGRGGKAGDPVDAGAARPLWAQRVELDRARLAFYALDPPRRAELLRAHAARQEAARPQETEEQRRAREAEAERLRALEAAKAARTEAERLVKEELARLIALQAQVRSVHEGLQQAHADLAQRRDAALGWKRRVRSAEADGPASADETYDALRRALRGSRDDLAAALDQRGSQPSEVPSLGPDLPANLPSDLPTDAVRERRARVGHELAELAREEEALGWERLSVVLDEINALNRERLNLLPSLSVAKRDAVTGFSFEGLDQARSEVRHLSLILRYHLHVARRWLGTVRGGSASAWTLVMAVTPLLLVVGLFLWARRRTPLLLRWADVRLAAADRAERRTTPSLGRRAVRLLVKTHRQVEWLLLFWGVLWSLPKGASGLLEVQLLASVVGWALVGGLVVNSLNAFAAGSAFALSPFEEGALGRLRLRSLRLVGRTVVVVALILVLTARLVGKGTIHSWVLSTCGFIAAGVFLILVRWWRSDVFERLGRVRRKTPTQAWILANRSGWKSFVAAMLGAVMLFTAGTLKVARRWLSGFDSARRVHAYLFKREIERLGEGQVRSELSTLPAPVLEQLHPERACTQWLPCPTDELLCALVRRTEARRGGLVAVIGSRGMGKSSLLDAVAQRVGGGARVECRPQTSSADLEAAVRLVGEGDALSPLVLVDDAQVLVEPRIGGLARFDDVLAFARRHSAEVTWVFAFDASVWPLLKRARDARPMFDETYALSPWSEGQLGALIAQRCEGAGVQPHYEGLLEKLPPGADELDRQEALEAKRVGYERMLWDYAGGNPGVALEVWRSSLGQDEAGAVHVRPLQVPDVARLELLPDSSLFVLRAVLQLAPTTAEAVAQATRMRQEEVQQDLRFGKALGVYDEKATHVRVAWPWLRAVTRLLERRHLLVAP